MKSIIPSPGLCNSMTSTMNWNLLVLFGVLCQGILGTLSEQDNVEPSETLVHQKRVINGASDGDKRELIRDLPYIVTLKQLRMPNFCTGVILKHNIVLTAAKCVELELTNYKVYSGKARQQGPGIPSLVHNLTEKRIFLGNHPLRSKDGIALVTVTPPFNYSINTRNIEFYEGHIIQPGLHGVVSGWGCNPTRHPGTANPQNLRSMNAQIISTKDCASLYQHHFSISASDICTLYPTEYQYCTDNDAGAPLVIEVNYEHYLVGVHFFKGAVAGQRNPEVFANLQNARYKSWILETIPIMEASGH